MGTGASIALAEKLASPDLKMYDLAFYLIEKEMAKYPEDKINLLFRRLRFIFHSVIQQKGSG